MFRKKDILDYHTGDTVFVIMCSMFGKKRIHTAIVSNIDGKNITVCTTDSFITITYKCNEIGVTIFKDELIAEQHI